MNLLKKLFICPIVIFMLFQYAIVHATDLMDVYHQALANDPVFKAAYDTYMAQSQQIPQATAA